jgi:hypothetical protein
VDTLNTGPDSLPFPWYVKLAAAIKKEALAQEYIWEGRESDHSTEYHFAKEWIATSKDTEGSSCFYRE